ncbi:MAG: D-alanyl-D-alanine carboxypeptidase [Verrucomicrobia bacterium]|nr:D-alanyl-D-alanine carboxypeptidase [Verrucomicrobiota bacterium]
MRKFLKSLVLAGALCLPAAVTASAQAQLAAAYALADHTTGYVLEAFKGEQKRPIASLTKIATAKVVLDWAQGSGTDLAQQIVVPPQAMGAGLTSNVGLEPNDLVSYRDLIYAALLQSDNAAASTLAFYVGSSLRAQGGPELQRLDAIDAFVAQMNALARQLGMERTLFVNPHGLEPRKGLQPYSTALDLTKLAAYAMRDAAFRFYVSQRERKISFNRNGQALQYLLRNTNELLGTAGVDGVKTGTTAKAGNCIVLSSQRDPEIKQQGSTTLVTPRRVNVIILGAADRAAAASQLLARAWGLYDQWAAAGRPTQVSPR